MKIKDKCAYCEKRKTADGELCNNCLSKTMFPQFAEEYDKKKKSIMFIGSMVCPKCHKYTKIFFDQTPSEVKCRYCYPESYKTRESEFFFNTLGQRIINEEVVKEERRIDIETKIKELPGLVFGAISILYLVIMLPAQSDFRGIIIGWLIIVGTYLLMKFFYFRK